MAAGWTASSLIPGLSGLQSGGGTRGTLSGGVAPVVRPPMNTTNNLIPPFVQGALNPFLNAVTGLQNQWRQTVAPQATNVTINNPADLLRAQDMRAQQQAAQAAAQSAQWNIGRAQNQLGTLPIGFGGITPMGGVAGAQRADLRQNIWGLENQLGQAQQASWGTGSASSGGGWGAIAY